MVRRWIASALVFVAIFCVMSPALTSAAGLTTIVPCGAETGANTQLCTVCSLAQLAQNILNDGIYLAVVLSAVLFAWAGFKYLTNIANPGEVSRAKEIFANVAIGLVIILASWLVVDILMRTLVGASGPPWSAIC
jgi:hypothetical protein